MSDQIPVYCRLSARPQRKAIDSGKSKPAACPTPVSHGGDVIESAPVSQSAFNLKTVLNLAVDIAGTTRSSPNQRILSAMIHAADNGLCWMYP